MSPMGEGAHRICRQIIGSNEMRVTLQTYWVLATQPGGDAGRRAAQQRDERTPLHSITSSARCWRCKGTSRPSALAVLRLITSSNLTGAWTGSSLGFAPFKILST